MAKLFTNYSLKNHNTFGLDVRCEYFFKFSEVSEIQQFLISEPKLIALPTLILGGGSNILFTKDFAGLVIYPQNKKITKLKEDNENVWINAESGVSWDDFVKYCVEGNYGGVENLSYIPGNIGASPVQNIGAYGVEVKDVIDSVEALEILTSKKHTFSNSDCRFDYRDSIFKNELKNKFIIVNVTFKLTKNHILTTHYGNIDEELKNYPHINIQTIREAIINIRKRKLPEPTEIGNAGSFFKNPIISAKKAEKLKEKFPNIVLYKTSEIEFKVAAGWLIEQCGWKGKEINGAGVHQNQALVIVRVGDATGKDIVNLSKKIQKSVKEKFDVEIQAEVIFL